MITNKSKGNSWRSSFLTMFSKSTELISNLNILRVNQSILEIKFQSLLTGCTVWQNNKGNILTIKTILILHYVKNPCLIRV